MRRRTFITLLGGAAAWPIAVRAQQIERMRRLGMLTNRAADDPRGQIELPADVDSTKLLLINVRSRRKLT
jgi:putative ABC transport system substrate-binding protein